MKKKKILFICCDMGKGGVSKSLASLLNCIDYKLYDVDLFLFEKKGLFLSQVPKNVNILDANLRFIEHIRKGKILQVAKAYFTSLKIKNCTNLERRWGLFWNSNKALYQKNNKQYDVAISYNDGIELYYLIDCVKAYKKIGYNHTDYTNSLTYKPNLDRKYYEQLDYLVTVSDVCARQLKKVFPEFEHKIRVIENIVKKDTLFSMVQNKDPYTSLIGDRKSINVIITVAGLYMRKGFDLSARALSILKSRGYKFKWIIIGAGPEEDKVVQTIRNNDIFDETIMLYEQSNPYNYVKWADIFMLNSYAEGKSIAIEEAKLLEMPILITNFSSAGDQIIDGVNGIIAELNAESIAQKLEILLTNKELREKISYYLKNNSSSNEMDNINKIYNMWEGKL